MKRSIEEATSSEAAAAPTSVAKRVRATPAPKKTSRSKASALSSSSSSAAAGSSRRAAKARLPLPVLPTVEGVLFGWGANSAGELGIDPETAPNPFKPRTIRSLDEAKLVAIEVGGMHTAAIAHDGTMFTWGVNDEKALGRTGVEFEPQPVALSHKFIRVACCDSATFAIAADGRLYGCGTFRDADGVLGFRKDIRVQEGLVIVADLAKHTFVDVAAGNSHVVALTDDGKVFTFGAGKRVEHYSMTLESTADDRSKALLADGPSVLGWVVSARGKREDSLTPHAVNLGTRATAVRVFAGAYHSFAQLSDGRVVAWGQNRDGQLGMGHVLNQDAPAVVASLGEAALGGAKVVQIAAGEMHTLVLTDDGSVYAIGSNRSGQLGLGKDAGKGVSVPTKIASLPPCSWVGSGAEHSCVVSRDGRLFVFGSGTVGQLGLGGEMDDDDEELSRWEPEHLPTPGRRALAADAGAQFSILLVTKKEA